MAGRGVKARKGERRSLCTRALIDEVNLRPTTNALLDRSQISGSQAVRDIGLAKRARLACVLRLTRSANH